MATPWREMSGEERIKAVTGSIVFAFVIVAFFFWLSAGEEASRDKKARAAEQQAAVAANDPVRFAKALVPGAEATFESDRNPQTGLIDRLSVLTVTYSIDPVPSSNRLARNSFFRQVTEIVPAVFNHFPKIEVVVVSGTAKMVDPKGHEKIEEVANVTFVHSIFNDINWPNVQPENVPVIANKHYLHPRLVSDLAESDPVRARSEKSRPRPERAAAPAEQAAAAEPAPKAPLGGDVESYADRFNAAARKYESTIRMRAGGCVRENMVTCTYMVGKIGLIAAANHGKPLATLMFVAGSDGDPVDLVMCGVLTMAVFAPTASRQAIQASFKQLMNAYAEDKDHRAEIVFEGVAYRLANTPLGVLLTVMRSGE